MIRFSTLRLGFAPSAGVGVGVGDGDGANPWVVRFEQLNTCRKTSRRHKKPAVLFSKS